ncbi:MAG: hypothetical protein WBM40_00790 [Thiohalocapsa sp.]
MKIAKIAIATTLLGASAVASAADVYRDVGAGNPDLANRALRSSEPVAVQPGVGMDLDRYHGFADGNPDIFQLPQVGAEQATRSSGEPAPIYVGPGLLF